MVNHFAYTYAKHGNIKLECDVYTHEDECDATNVPVLLFFHAGGLVGGSRSCVPPWLLQTCYQRKWPLISPSYRLLPQTGAQGLLEDATAAFHFAQTYGASVTGRRRQVIVAGASAGFFMASLVAFHCHRKPAILLSISGVPTFQHEFFASSIRLTPNPIQDKEIEHFFCGPAIVGTTPAHDAMTLSISQLLPSGERNPEYVRPSKPVATCTSPKTPDRRILYDYYLYNNDYSDLVGHVDPGSQSTFDRANHEQLMNWPRTIFIHGLEDKNVSVAVVTDAAQHISSNLDDVFLAPEEGHLFEATSYLEDDSAGMDVVRKAIEALDAYFKA